MIKKFFFCSLFLGLLFLLGTDVHPVSAADCICICKDAKGLISQSTTISLERCKTLCEGNGVIGQGGTVQPGGCNSGTAPVTPLAGTAPITPIKETTANAPTVHLDNPLGSITSPQVLVGKVINSILGIIGSLALLMFVFGGITWMTSSGNQEKVKKGRDIIVWSAIGLAVIFMSYALIRFVLSVIVK